MEEKNRQFDFEQAKNFLEALDDPEAQFSFQTFDDSAENTESQRKELARQMHGSFAECKEELVRLNLAGAGILVSIPPLKEFDYEKYSKKIS